ncbi:MAG: hypothetical protein JWQ35_2686 [Bacteriovoracaceae bacterium]|nr:hypothetical protein [Bacteriovoracaceae bacterium]
MIFKKIWFAFGTIIALIFTTAPVRADFWGGDVAVLMKILAEDLRRYQQLQTMISQSKDQREFMRILNSGIDNINNLITALPIKDQRILENLQTFQDASRQIETLYGSVPVSEEAPLEHLHDETVAESIKLTNDSKIYANQQEQNANRIITESRSASPKGAARISAQTSAEILHTLNQLLKIDGQMLKLQSEQLALRNKEEKDSVRHFQQVRTDVATSTKTYQANLDFPKF